MDFDVNAAKAAGHTDEDIARIQQGIAAARAAGHSDDEIQQYLQSEESGGSSAQADATAESNAAAGLGDTGVSGADLLGAGKSFVRGVGRGFANIPEPSDVVTGITNIPKWLSNDYNAKIHPAVAGPEGWNSPPPLPVELNKNPDHLGVSENYNKDFPTDPNHPFADVVGQVAGPAIVEGVATGGASIPGQVAGIGRAITTTTGSLVGGETGGAVDRALGGSGEFGSLIGGGIGGGLLPGLIPQVGWKGAARRFTDEDSAARLAAYDRMRTGLTGDAGADNASLGLLGSKQAGQYEDATAGIPGGGRRAYDARSAQHRQMDAAAQAAAEIPRGGPSQGNLTPSAMGQNVMDTAEIASQSAQAAQEAAFAPMKARIGPDTVLPSKTLPTELDRLSRGATVGVDKPTYDYFGNLVEANAREPLASGAPKVMDPALEASLQAQLARAQTNLSIAKPGSPLHTAASQSVADLSDAINANRNPTYDNLIKLRTKSANPLDSAENFNFNAHMDVKQALTAAQKEVAASQGVSPAEFDTANLEYGRLADQRDFFNKLKDKTGQGDAYSAMMSGNARHNADQIAALAEHAPAQTSKLMADELELKLRGQRNAGGPPAAEGIAPQIKTAPNWFSGLPDQTREIMSGAPASGWENSRLNSLFQVMDADARRPSRTIPGAGGNTLGMSTVFKDAATPASIALLRGPGAATATGLAMSLAPALRARAAGRFTTSPWATRRTIAARDQPWLNDKNTLARIMAAAYSGGQSNQ